MQTNWFSYNLKKETKGIFNRMKVLKDLSVYAVENGQQ